MTISAVGRSALFSFWLLSSSFCILTPLLLPACYWLLFPRTYNLLPNRTVLWPKRNRRAQKNQIAFIDFDSHFSPPPPPSPSLIITCYTNLHYCCVWLLLAVAQCCCRSVAPTDVALPFCGGSAHDAP